MIVFYVVLITFLAVVAVFSFCRAERVNSPGWGVMGMIAMLLAFLSVFQLALLKGCS
jgi:hypothetical protein